jgi:hypothetical protein
MKPSFRDLYMMSRLQRILFVIFLWSMGGILLVNIAAMIWNLWERSYGNATISGVATVMLIASLGQLLRSIRRHRREYLAHAQKQLDECYRWGLCPDCGGCDFDEFYMTCRSKECGSRFVRDPNTRRWWRI